jgi:hypothetical protein
LSFCEFAHLCSFFFLSIRKITWLNSQQPKTREHVEDPGPKIQKTAVFLPCDQSICTLIPKLSGRPDIFLWSGTLKIIRSEFQGTNIFFLLAIWNFEREEAKLSLLFLNNKKNVQTLFFAPCFLHPLFCTLFFSGSQTDPLYQNWLTGRWTVITKFGFMEAASNNSANLRPHFFLCFSYKKQEIVKSQIVNSQNSRLLSRILL